MKERTWMGEMPKRQRWRALGGLPQPGFMRNDDGMMTNAGGVRPRPACLLRRNADANVRRNTPNAMFHRISGLR
jgi:hypothetical protein